MIVDAASGKVNQEAPFAPLQVDGDFWLVRKPGETQGCWSYSLKQRQYVAHFRGVELQRRHYPDCTAAVSRDGRHVLFRAKHGPLARVFIYGDLVTKQTVRWESPTELDRCRNLRFVWVETPD